MNEFKGTPGPWYDQVEGVYRDSPWTIEHDKGHDASWAPVTTDRGRTLALVVNDDTKRPMDFQDAEMHANAALIAAAPDLLEALQSAPLTLHTGSMFVDGACACSQCEFVRKARTAIAKATSISN